MKFVLKHYHAVDASASKCFDDEKGISDIDTGTPSSVDNDCEGRVRYDDAHGNFPNDQSPTLDEKQKVTQLRGQPRKTISIDKSIGEGGVVKATPRKQILWQSRQECWC